MRNVNVHGMRNVDQLAARLHGVRIRLVSKSGTQFNHMTTSVGDASSSDGPVHFGLGGDTKVDSVTTYWPSGIVQTMENVSAHQILKVTEPSH